MILWMLVAFVFILGPLMFLHELGHFWAAQRNGIQVEEFGFGLGPRLFKLFTHKGTEYTVRAIPFAAFVRMAGEDEAKTEAGLLSAPHLSKIQVFAAGPIVNIMFTILLLFMAFFFGPPAFYEIAVSSIDLDSPAADTSLHVYDVITAVDEIGVSNASELSRLVREHQGEQINITVRRDNQLVDIPIIPRVDGEYDPEIEGPLGIQIMSVAGPPNPQGFIEASESAMGEFKSQMQLLIEFPKMLIRATQVSVEKAGTDELIAPEEDIRNYRPLGIFGILQLVGYSIEVGVQGGNLYFIFRTAALISVALGTTNLLPIPALDGGRILFVIFDWIWTKLLGKKISPQVEIAFNAIGVILLLLLMVVITWQDIVNPLIEYPTKTPIP